LCKCLKTVVDQLNIVVEVGVPFFSPIKLGGFM
jgi:hypothetical protein